MAGNRRRPQAAPRRAAYTLLEVVISSAIISVMLVAALQAVAASRMSMRRLGDHSRGALLAQDLMTEILEQSYCDDAYGLGSFGVNPTEAAPGDRSLYDDVDDYDDWVASPPEYKDGTPIPGTTDFERRVRVDWVQPANLLQTSGSETGIKRIVVTVSLNGEVVARLTAIRTMSWPHTSD